MKIHDSREEAACRSVQDRSNKNCEGKIAIVTLLIGMVMMAMTCLPTHDALTMMMAMPMTTVMVIATVV